LCGCEVEEELDGRKKGDGDGTVGGCGAGIP
jgi:hypothetical protein